MPTVFILQEPLPNRFTQESTRDFTPAEQYGTLKMVLAHDVLFDNGTDIASKLWEAGLKDFQEGDYIVLAGHPVTIGVATALLANDFSLNLLIWSGRTREYSLMKFDLCEAQDYIGID